MGALQELPRDVLLDVLHKLAEQDTLALLRATFDFKALRETGAEAAPDLWKTAFLSLSVSSDFSGSEEFEGFENEVEALGG